MAKKPMTNVQAIKDIMEYSKFGPLAQLFVIDALYKWTEKISSTPIETLREQFGETAFISADAWQGVANEIKAKLDARLTR